MLDAILATAGVDEARVCRAALREGLILEHAMQTPPGRRVSTRRRSPRPAARMSA